MDNTNFPAADTAEAAATPTNASDADQQPAGDQAPPQGETSLLPKTMFGEDVKTGDTLSLKVVHVYEDEIEVAPMSESQEEAEESPPTPESPEMSGAMSQMDTMAGPGVGS